MGGGVGQSTVPRFEVRAVGSWAQRSGCADHAITALGSERLAALCRGECYNPSERRRSIERIEIVRIRPQRYPGEPLDALIEDPWQRFECPADPNGCRVEFEDPEFVPSGRDTVYYARAIEEKSSAIHGSNPLGCTYDETGNCVAIEPCGVRVPKSEDCLSETRQRAWSSPIFVDYRERG